MDGQVIIGTKLDSKNFDKQLSKLETRYKNEQIDLEVKLANFDNAKQEVNKLNYELKNVKDRLQEINARKIELKAMPDFSSNAKAFNEYTSLNIEQSELNAKAEQYNIQLNKAHDNLTKNEASYEKIKNKVNQTGLEYQKLNAEINKTNSQGLSGVAKSINDVGKGVQGVTKKLVKWGLAIFGIRSAYQFFKSSVSILSEYNEQIGTDIQYIRFALAATLQPVIERIIQLVYTLLQYIGYIAKAWFGVNIFANASVKAFQSNNKALKDSNKQAKQLKKTLAGFDEMNVLENNKESDNGGSNGGVGTPSTDLSNIGEKDLTNIYKWTDKAKEKFDDLYEIITGKIRKAIEDLGLSDFFLKSWELAASGVKDVFHGLLDSIGGILEMIVGLFTGDADKIKEGFKKLVKGIGEIAKGLVKIVIGVWGEIVALVWQFVIQPILNAFKEGWGNIKQGFKDLWDSIVIVFKEMVDTLVQTAKELWKSLKQGFKDLFNGIKTVFSPLGNFFKNIWNNLVSGAKTAWTNVKKAFGSVTSFFSNIVNSVINKFRSLGSKVGSAIGSAFKAVINGVLRTIENVLNSPIRAINSLIGIVNKISPTKIGKLSTFYLPRLAKGGIVNMPSRGIPIGSAIAGESGAEGVIPLTDSQQMAMLGEAIGKYITINANITNTMNGRVISREIQRVQNNSNFAMNR